MSISDLLMRSLDLSLGITALGVERVRELTEDLIKRGELTTDEANKVVNDFRSRAEEERRSFQEWMRDQARKMLQQAGAADAARLEQLEMRVATLERQFAQTQTTTEEPVTVGPVIGTDEELGYGS